MFKQLLAAILLLLCAVPALAEGPRTFAVLPFGVHGPQEYQYLSQGVQSMLSTRLTRPENFVPLDAGTVKKAVKTLPADAAAAEKLRQSLKADYLIWGALTIMGQECSLDVNVLDPSGANRPHPMRTTLNEVIPSLETVAADISAQVSGKAEVSDQKPVVRPMNQGLIVNESQAGAIYANPSIKYEDTDASMGRWRSQSLPFASRGMVVCDGDGDGKNEVFLMTASHLLAFRVENRQMVQIAEMVLPKGRNYVRLNSMDLGRNGRHELIVSAALKKEPRSLIVGFDGGKFSVQEDNIPYFLGVLNMPPAFAPTLVGQGVGRIKYLDSKIHQMIRSGGKYTPGPSVSLPMGGNVFNVTFLPAEGDYQVVMIDDYDRMRVYNSAGNLLASTEETYAGSSLGIEYHSAPLGMKQPDGSSEPLDMVYIPLRGISSNLDRDNRFELVISRNISVSAQFFSRYRDYPQGEIHCLFWDGVGMSLQWKTARIKGTVTDYALTDLDNDGVLDLIVCVNSHTGLTGTKERRATIMAYPLDLGQGSTAGPRILQ